VPPVAEPESPGPELTAAEAAPRAHEPVVHTSRTMPAPGSGKSWALPPSAQAVARPAPAVSPDAVESEAALVWTAPAGPSAPTFVPSSGQPDGQPAEAMAGFGVGRWFQPLPGTPPVAAADGVPGPGARMVAAGGTPVHAIAAGTISAGPGGAMKLHTDEGLHIHYAGLVAATTPPGSRVAAGSILGAVAGAHGRTTRGELVLDVRDPTGEPVDAVRLLLGLPDPNELGFAAVGGGLGVDPDDLDRMLGEAQPTP
jgi:translation initiation factor IF-2